MARETPSDATVYGSMIMIMIIMPHELKNKNSDLPLDMPRTEQV